MFTSFLLAFLFLPFGSVSLSLVRSVPRKKRETDETPKEEKKTTTSTSLFPSGDGDGVFKRPRALRFPGGERPVAHGRTHTRARSRSTAARPAANVANAA